MRDHKKLWWIDTLIKPIHHSYDMKGNRKEFLYHSIIIEKSEKPAIGLEPTTFGLQNRYSTNWVKQAIIHTLLSFLISNQVHLDYFIIKKVSLHKIKRILWVLSQIRKLCLEFVLGKSWTLTPQIRSLMLYPIKLQAHEINLLVLIKFDSSFLPNHQYYQDVKNQEVQ